MGTTGYQKYIPVTIATDVSEETVAAIAENQDELEGISVAEDTIRKYKDGPYYSQILGYTGKISTDELTALNSKEGMDGVKRAGCQRIRADGCRRQGRHRKGHGRISAGNKGL